MWILNFSLYDKIVAEFHTPPFSSFHLDELPNFLTNGLGRFLKRIPKVAVGSESSLQIDPALLAVMMPFQLESLRFVVNHGGRALLADDMGTYVLTLLLHPFAMMTMIRLQGVVRQYKPSLL